METLTTDFNMGYTENIPLATTNPSQDQELIKDNFNAIKAAFNLNHGNFDDPTQGKHDLVDFVRQTLPKSAKSNEGLLFSALINGASELFYGKDGAEAKQMTGVKPGTGGTAISFSWNFVDGLNLRFGNVIHSGVITPITFATSFPNTAYVVLFSPQGAAALVSGNNVQNLTKTGFSLNSSKDASGSSRYFYIALGS